MGLQSPLGRWWHSPRTTEEEQAAIRDMQRRAIDLDMAVIRISAVGCPVMRQGILQEARKQAGIDGGRT